MGENGLELMAKDMRTQPTSPICIPTSQNLDFGFVFVGFYTFFMCFGTQNRFFLMLPEKYLTGVGQKDADWKVSASEIDMIFGLWEKHRNLKFNICLPPNHGFGDCGFFLISRIHLSLGELGLGRLGEPVQRSRGNRAGRSYLPGT